jgi:hypothetical protein
MTQPTEAAFQLSRPAHQFKLKLADPPKPAQTLTEKYRPRDLASIVGQGEIVFRMEAFLEAPYSSAWLFHGTTGVGKTTVALAIAAELGAVEFGGLEIIRSGIADAEAVESALLGLRYTPMLGSGWKVVIVDEADSMSYKAGQLWLSSLEDLPEKSVVIFTTNSRSKFPDKFLDRCEQLGFADDAEEHKGDAQELVNRVWLAETGGLHGAPNAQYLDGNTDDAGKISYRRVVRALEPLLAARNSSRARPDSSPRIAPAVIARSPAPESCSAVDWPAVARRYNSGTGLTDLSRSLGVPTTTIHGRLKKLGVVFGQRKARH